MIDPNQVTNIRRTVPELEEFLLFCIVVAGKNADQQTRKLDAFLGGAEPFRHIRSLSDGKLEASLKRVKLGKYALLRESFRRLAASNVDLRQCTWEDLTDYPGIGIKTAKFFVLNTRPNERHAVLDTHVLSWMRQHWNPAGQRRLGVPRHSPQDPATYRFWEFVYFGMILARSPGGLHPPAGPTFWAQVDLDLWKERRAK